MYHQSRGWRDERREERGPGDQRGSGDGREVKERDHREGRDPREIRDPRDHRDPRDSRNREFRDSRDHRDSRDRDFRGRSYRDRDRESYRDSFRDRDNFRDHRERRHHTQSYHSNENVYGYIIRRAPADTASLESLRPQHSKWDIRPEGETGSAKEAKQRTLDQERGITRAVAPTQTPAQSLNSRRLIVTRTTGDPLSLETIQKSLSSFLGSVAFSGVTPADEILKVTPLGADHLLVETGSSELATLLIAEYGTKSAQSTHRTDAFQVERPGQYVAFQEDLSLLCVTGIPAGTEKDEVTTLLAKYGTVSAPQFVEDRATHETRGTVFFRLDNAPKDVVEKLGQETMYSSVLRCFRPYEAKYTQAITLDARTILDYGDRHSDKVSQQQMSAVVRFLNCASASDLASEAKATKIRDSFREQCNRYGKVKSLVLVGPETVRLFVQFESLEDAKKCLFDLPGRHFWGRLVIGGFYDEQDFERGLY